ncbi:hypothetical protein GN956_G5611 [Arapaima gigas]
MLGASLGKSETTPWPDGSVRAVNIRFDDVTPVMESSNGYVSCSDHSTLPPELLTSPAPLPRYTEQKVLVSFFCASESSLSKFTLMYLRGCAEGWTALLPKEPSAGTPEKNESRPALCGPSARRATRGQERRAPRRARATRAQPLDRGSSWERVPLQCCYCSAWGGGAPGAKLTHQSFCTGPWEGRRERRCHIQKRRVPRLQVVLLPFAPGGGRCWTPGPAVLSAGSFAQHQLRTFWSVPGVAMPRLLRPEARRAVTALFFTTAHPQLIRVAGAPSWTSLEALDAEEVACLQGGGAAFVFCVLQTCKTGRSVVGS